MRRKESSEHNVATSSNLGLCLGVSTDSLAENWTSGVSGGSRYKTEAKLEVIPLVLRTCDNNLNKDTRSGSWEQCTFAT